MLFSDFQKVQNIDREITTLHQMLSDLYSERLELLAASSKADAPPIQPEPPVASEVETKPETTEVETKDIPIPEQPAKEAATEEPASASGAETETPKADAPPIQPEPPVASEVETKPETTETEEAETENENDTTASASEDDQEAKPSEEIPDSVLVPYNGQSVRELYEQMAKLWSLSGAEIPPYKYCPHHIRIARFLARTLSLEPNFGSQSLIMALPPQFMIPPDMPESFLFEKLNVSRRSDSAGQAGAWHFFVLYDKSVAVRTDRGLSAFRSQTHLSRENLFALALGLPELLTSNPVIFLLADTVTVALSTPDSQTTTTR